MMTHKSFYLNLKINQPPTPLKTLLYRKELARAPNNWLNQLNNHIFKHANIHFLCATLFIVVNFYTKLSNYRPMMQMIIF